MSEIPEGYERGGIGKWIIYRLAEGGCLALCGLMILGLVIAVKHYGYVIDAIITLLNWIVAVIVLIGFPLLVVAFFAARFREWRAERDIKYFYSVDRMLIQEQLDDWMLDQSGDERFPNWSYDDEDA